MTVLTKDHLTFYEFENRKNLIVVNKFDIKGEYMTIGSGRDEDEICLYAMVDKLIKCKNYKKKLDGQWYAANHE